MAKETRINHRNHVRQVIIGADGSKKVIFHEKHFNKPQYADRGKFWKMTNEMPKPNSKTQQRKAEQQDVANLLERVA